MSRPFCVNCQVFDIPFRFPLPLVGPESHKLYYNTYSRSPSEVLQYCRNEYSLKLSEKQYRDNCNELDDCAYWDIEIVTAIVKVIAHELHRSNIHVIVESHDRNDWNAEHLSGTRKARRRSCPPPPQIVRGKGWYDPPMSIVVVCHNLILHSRNEFLVVWLP